MGKEMQAFSEPGATCQPALLAATFRQSESLPAGREAENGAGIDAGKPPSAAEFFIEEDGIVQGSTGAEGVARDHARGDITDFAIKLLRGVAATRIEEK